MNGKNNADFKGVFGNWYDKSKSEKAKEKRLQAQKRRRNIFLRIRWYIIVSIIVMATIFLFNNFDNFLGREVATVTYVGGNISEGFYIYVNTRYDKVWLYFVDWESLQVGDEVVLRETEFGTRIEDAPIGLFKRLFPLS